MRLLHPFSRTRRIASVVLFVWLFATAVSWAHACLPQSSAATAAPPEHHQRIDARGHRAADHDALAEPGATNEPDPARQACASFCETEQSIVAKPQPSKGDGGADADLPPPAVREGWPAFTPGRTEPRWRPLAAPPPPGPAVAIAFLRLTR